MLLWEEEGERLVMATGNVELISKEASLRADRILAWTSGGEKPELREIYLEGNVVSRRPGATAKEDLVILAERMYYDHREHRAFVLEMSGRGWLKRLDSPAVMRAREARATAKDRWEAKDVMLTTCTFGEPHYHLHFDRATITGWDPDPKKEKDTYNIWPFREWKVSGEGGALDLFGLTLPVLPKIEVSSTLVHFPIRSGRGGQSRRFGYWAETDWGLDVTRGAIDAISPLAEAHPDDKDTKWGEVNWEADWRSKRGWGGGLDLEWKWADYSGYVDTYYLHDTGGDPDIPFDAQFIGQYERDRGRTRLFHRHKFSPEWRGEIEASYLSDRALLPEFFEKEFKEGKEQESVVYVRWTRDNMGAYYQERHRLNDFQTQNEFLPRIRYFLYDLPLFGGVTYTTHVDAARIRTRFDEDLDVPTEDATRLDVVNELTRPVDLGVATVSPLARARNTLYHEDLEGDDEQRFIGTVGVRASTQVSGIHDVTWEAVGLRRVRHIMNLEGAYTHNVKNTLDPAELFPFDDVDLLDEFEEVAFEMRHRLQTKVADGDKTATHEFLSLGAAVEYYPEAGRDTRDFEVSNFEPPFHWITLAPHDSTGVLERRLWSNVNWDVRMQPRNFFAVTATGEYNPVHRQEEARQYSVLFTPTETLSADVGEVFVKDLTTAFTVGLKWQMTERWRVDATGQYDFESDEFLNWRAVLTRDFHDFNVEVVAEANETRDERRFYITAYPKFIRRRR
ncbi:MAG: LPS assembly protein LptD [Planctomycetes bacterium]|nr:LPS assembly protein LptD [Planctomycetota bacterium]